MIISSADLLGTAGIAADRAATDIATARAGVPDPVSYLTSAEDKLVQALSEVRAARWGILRRMPQFDDKDLDLLLDAETQALTDSRGVIPAPDLPMLG